MAEGKRGGGGGGIGGGKSINSAQRIIYKGHFLEGEEGRRTGSHDVTTNIHTLLKKIKKNEEGVGRIR